MLKEIKRLPFEKLQKQTQKEKDAERGGAEKEKRGYAHSNLLAHCYCNQLVR